MSGQNPLAYYATQGWKEGHDPSPGFSTTYYLKSNADVEAAGVCPLEHYLRHGRREGRLPRKGASPDDSLVPDAPPQVTLKVRRAHATPGRLRPDTAAATAARPPADTIICLSHVVPLPPRAGNEYRIHRMLVRLRRSGYRIVLVMSPLSPQTIEDAQWEKLAAAYGNVVHCERDGRVRHRLDECPDVLAPLDGQRTRNYAALLDEVRPMPRTARELLHVDRTFCHDALIATLVQLQSSLRPCAVIAEYIWMTRGLPLLDPGLLTVIDTIDVFSTYHEKVGAFGVSGWDVPPEEEARRLARAKVIVAIQPEEARILSALAPDREVVTAGVDFEVVEHSDWPADPIVFCVGSDNPRNMLGLRDFLKFAWPEIRSAVPDARLAVAGSVGAAVPDYAQGVDVLGHVDDLDPLYLRARVVVNPAVAGTGLKIKTVEALSRLRPIVTWPNGLEGLPPDMAELVPPAQDWFDFAERVITWLQAKTPAFDAATAASIRHMLSADHVYGELEARLARFFDAHRSRKDMSPSAPVPVHAFIDVSRCAHGAAVGEIEWLQRTDALGGLVERATVAAREPLDLPKGWTGAPEPATRMCERAFFDAACHGAHLLVVFDGARPASEAIGSLAATLAIDPLFGVVHPRFSHAEGRRVVPSMAGGKASRFDVAREVLATLPDFYVTTECLSPCFLIRRELVANLAPTIEGWIDVRGLLAEYAVRARRLGFRTVIANRAVVRLDPFAADSAELQPDPKDVAVIQSAFPELESATGVLPGRGLRKRTARVAVLRRTGSLAAGRPESHRIHERHRQGRSWHLRRPVCRPARSGKVPLGDGRRRGLSRARPSVRGLAHHHLAAR